MMREEEVKVIQRFIQRLSVKSGTGNGIGKATVEKIREFAREEGYITVRTCRICGCTDDHACPGGCYWVEEDLCSECVGKIKGD